MKHETFADFETLRGSFDASSRPVLTVDTDKYRAMLEDTDLTDDEKRQVLESLWTIIVSFVELGFHVHPLQEVCGQDERAALPCAKDGFDGVNCKEPEPD